MIHEKDLPEWYWIIWKTLRHFECFNYSEFDNAGGYDAYNQLQAVAERAAIKSQPPVISDGFSLTSPAACPKCGAAMVVIRPGDIRCSAECHITKTYDCE